MLVKNKTFLRLFFLLLFFLLVIKFVLVKMEKLFGTMFLTQNSVCAQFILDNNNGNDNNNNDKSLCYVFVCSPGMCAQVLLEDRA